METSDAVTIQYRGDRDFEILVEPELAKEAKLEGKEYDIQRLLFVQEVFEDSGEGKRASADDLEDEFGTRQIMEAAEQIFENGDMQLTTEQKKDMRKEKRKQLVDMIARRAQDPKTGNPHPPKRVENALDEAGFNINWNSDLEEEFDKAIDVLRPIIPVSLDEKTVVIQIPVDNTGRAYDRIQQVADVKEEQWGNEYFRCKVEMPAGALSELIDELQEITGGQTEMREI